MGTVLLILLILLLFGALPPLGLHHYGWQAPGLLGIVLIVVIILLLTGRL